jgi:ABC-type transport system involved in multi-copper enzyme maturation permease subunit
MLRRMIVKEWKEKTNLMVFGLAVFVLFSVAFSVYAKDPETLDLLVSTLLLVFPVAFALLLGASGFASEFQDGAWAYLFSRPVKRWRIWLAKYASLLTVLYGVILLLDLLIRFHPVLRTAYMTFSFSVIGELSHSQFLYLLPLLFITTAFSLSLCFFSLGSDLDRSLYGIGQGNGPRTLSRQALFRS